MIAIPSSSFPAIDPFDKQSHLTYAQAAKIWPGRKVSPHTVWRCASKGKREIKLPTIDTPDGARTTREAIRWFFTELQRVKQQQSIESRPRRRQLDPAIIAECEAAGI